MIIFIVHYHVNIKITEKIMLSMFYVKKVLHLCCSYMNKMSQLWTFMDFGEILDKYYL